MTLSVSGSEAATVFFDGQCPLCSKEIRFYQRQGGAEAINWVDVTKVNVDDLPSGLTREVAMAKFHVVTAKGKLISGGEAFSSLWLSLPAFNWVGRLFRISFLALFLEAGYRVFLPCRPLLQRYLPQTLKQTASDPKIYKTKK